MQKQPPQQFYATGQSQSTHIVFDSNQQQQPMFSSPPVIAPEDQLQFIQSTSSSNNLLYNNYTNSLPPQQHQQQYYSSTMQFGNNNQSSAHRTFTGNPFGTGGYSDEQPLCEELGVNFQHISSKSLSVLNVLRTPDRHIMDDTDLAGPIFFCILFGAFLLVSGKSQFGYIYGMAVVGCVSMYTILNLMSESGIDGSRTASVLGYCLLPMVILSISSMLLNLKGLVGLVLSVTSILWCTYSASTMFVTVLSMRDQRILVAYPVGLLYTVFALLTVF